MRILFAALAVFILLGCEPSFPTTEARLPEPTQQVQSPQQWKEYCAREGQEDPAYPTN